MKSSQADERSERRQRGGGLSRRAFLQSSGAAVLALSLGRLRFAAAAVGAAAGAGVGIEVRPYRQWEDLYRQQWAWDKVARSTHLVNCGHSGHCSWNVYLKDGIVWREEQAAAYPKMRPGVPDYNPRGCQKGGCYSHRMYDPSRLKYPLKRTGERGEAKWQRISWDQALREISDVMLDTMAEEGTDRVVWSMGSLITMGNLSAAVGRLGLLLDSVILDINTEIGDGHQGAAVTFGKLNVERSLDDYFHSDIILVWGGNPTYTQIPSAHFFNEARYAGKRVVAIAPDYNASAIHADEWVPVKVGTDAALALSMAQVVLADGLEKRAFIREQTDLPFLVRLDTRKFLRASDLEEGGRDDRFFVFDEATKKIAPVPTADLGLGALQPALDGTFEVETRHGRVRVQPVFALLKETLDQQYRPEQAAVLCGVPAHTIRRLARDIGKAGAVATVQTLLWGKFYHGNLIERAQILLLALCGQIGHKGAGYSAFPVIAQDGFEPFLALRQPGPAGKAQLAAAMAKDAAALKAEGFTDEMIAYEQSRRFHVAGAWVSSTLFFQVHGGLLELTEKSAGCDPYLKRSAKEYLDEALAKGWQFVSPPPGKPPRVFVEVGSNVLRRLRGYQQLFKNFIPNLHALVTLDSRMSSTARFSDYVLPVTAWYERTDHKWVAALTPFIHTTHKLASFYEAKSDWEILALLARTIQERAVARGLPTVKDRRGNDVRLDRLWNDFSLDGTYTEADEDKVAGDIIGLATNLQGVEWETLKKDGFARFTSVGRTFSIGLATDIEPDESLTPLTWHTVKKIPWPTLTRRIQFYIDQDFYLELGEALPVHKDPPTSGGKYPLGLTGGHTRWSIHASWRDDALLLRQQRGEPVMYMNTDDARARGVADGSRVEVRNDIGAFQIQAKLSPSIRPGQVIIYHAWENYQFRDGKGYQCVMPTPLNPVDLGGGQFHLRPMFAGMQPIVSDRDTRVEVAPVAPDKSV